MITLLVMTDGRECVTDTVLSALDNLEGPITRKVIYNDSGDREHQRWIADELKPFGFEQVVHGAGRQGFGGAIRTAWHHIAKTDRNDYVFHLEDDFTFNRPVELDCLSAVLHENPHLVQLALRRQAWNDVERKAGGVVEQNPGGYTDASGRTDCLGGHRWLEHRLFFTTNPSLYRRSLCTRGWPRGDRSEGVFTQRLLADPLVRFGYWGARDSEPWVTHTGTERVGSGY